MTAETLINKVNRRRRSVPPLRLRKKYLSRSTINAIGSMLTKTSTSLHSTVHPTGDNLNYTLDYEYIPGTRGVDGSGRVIRYHEGVFSVDYGFALTNRSPIDAGGSNVFRRDFMWNDRGLLRRSIDRQFDVHYRYGHDGQRALKYSVSGSQHRETLYFNRMFTITQMATRDIESKHIFVGNTRIVTKRRQAGHDNIGHEIRMQYFYHGDHLGSVQLVTDWEGNIYEHLEYTPYGELWVDHSVRSVGAYPTVFRFTAHERDPETGFTYAGARYLDPRTSRWISADPAMWEGDFFPRAPINDEARRHNENLPNGGVFNVINLHVRNYANNNPVRYVDPDGRIAWKALAIPLAVNYGPAIIAGIGGAGAAISFHVSTRNKNPFPENPHIPPRNRPQSPMGKRANAGPENINNIGDIGGPDFNLPSGRSGRIFVFIAGVANLIDNFNRNSNNIDSNVTTTQENTEVTNVLTTISETRQENNQRSGGGSSNLSDISPRNHFHFQSLE